MIGGEPHQCLVRPGSGHACFFCDGLGTRCRQFACITPLSLRMPREHDVTQYRFGSATGSCATVYDFKRDGEEMAAVTDEFFFGKIFMTVEVIIVYVVHASMYC